MHAFEIREIDGADSGFFAECEVYPAEVFYFKDMFAGSYFFRLDLAAVVVVSVKFECACVGVAVA